MYHCGRCVMYLQSRLLGMKVQHLHVAKLCHYPKSTTYMHTALLPPSGSQSCKDRWRSYGIRFFSDQRTDSPPHRHTASRITEQDNPQHGLVKVINSERHQISSAPGPVPAEHTSIGMEIFHYNFIVLCFISLSSDFTVLVRVMQFYIKLGPNVLEYE